jgi:hypothetical protein
MIRINTKKEPYAQLENVSNQLKNNLKKHSLIE